MEELVIKSEKGTPVTTSLMVSKKFGKRHADVIRAIEDVARQTPENECKRNFAFTYQDVQMPNGGYRQEKVYLLTRDGFSAVVLGFTGEQAIKFRWEYIEAFNKMEETIKTGGFQVPTSFSEALLLAARQQEQIESQQQQLTIQAPKVKYYEDVLSSENLMTITDIAKNYGYSAVSLNEWLRAWGVQYKKGKRYYITAKYQSNDYVRIIPSLQVRDGKTFVVNEMRWTESGRKFIHELLISKGLINRQKSLMI
jgi:Rha family phage regulatory protein